MTAARAGQVEGELLDIVSEGDLTSDTPKFETAIHRGTINADLTLGVAAGAVPTLKANTGLSCNGMMLAGQGFKVDVTERSLLVRSDGSEAEKFIKPYIGGSELLRGSRGGYVIDLFGLTEQEARQRLPQTYTHVLRAVKPERDSNRRPALKTRWWVFAEPHRTFRPALIDLGRYIATTETSKHRVFQFLNTSVVPDHMVVAIATDDACTLGVLSSRIHLEWALRTGGWLGIGNDPRYSKSKVFDPFPFPDPTLEQRAAIADLGEELDATRKAALAEHPRLTMTGLYNLVEKLRAGTTLTAAEEKDARDARARIVLHLHDQLDAAVAAAYGWADDWERGDLTPAEIVARLVALNAERAAEEAAGHVRWLRPEYQIPRFAPK